MSVVEKGRLLLHLCLPRALLRDDANSWRPNSLSALLFPGTWYSVANAGCHVLARHARFQRQHARVSGNQWRHAISLGAARVDRRCRREHRACCRRLSASADKRIRGSMVPTLPSLCTRRPDVLLRYGEGDPGAVSPTLARHSLVPGG